MKRKFNGYALPLALIFVAIFSIIIANIVPRSNLNNQTTHKIIDHFKMTGLAKQYLLDYIKSQAKSCPLDNNYDVVCSSNEDSISIKITSKETGFSSTLIYDESQTR
jgi:hypothetical protein